MLDCAPWITTVGSKLFNLQDIVVLPYKDSLLLFSRYLQQLVMESLGKEFDLDGNKVNFVLHRHWICMISFSIQLLSRLPMCCEI